MDTIARKWRDLSGQSNWKGLLDPLDTDLRRYIIHYGQLAQAAYDAFNTEKASKCAGNSRYAMSDFFSKVGLENGNCFKYVVTKFLYATCKAGASESFILKSFNKDAWSQESNWIGYVAVATDEGKAALGRRDIVVAWRGTINAAEWVQDLHFHLDSAPLIFDDARAKVHHGFYSVYTSNKPGSEFNDTCVRHQVLEEVRRLVEEYNRKNEEISITVIGHSLGAALATINAVDIVAKGLNIPKDQPEKACSVTTFVFASPRVGNSHFAKIFTGHKHLRALRIRNETDVVPKLPLKHLFFLDGFSDVGEELVIDTTKSKYLKKEVSAHNLEVYLHGVAGTQGKNGEIFDLDESLRDIALLNKSKDALKDEYHCPVAWRVHENKGMVQQKDGTWKLMDHNKDGILFLHARL
ncbi:hypothetical protein AAZX31_07G188900 [Glycine max]|uniref:Phospholipase A1 n=2 Tax=Glycine subgen. Soja TaxID=1462606 RepID=I1KLS7_SOYBN|nr:phospholipase A1-IIgamma [Glycine max]XP_028242042.1 phospholipase A1-IIgamma-like [Glycine soja]KAG5010691.1 hypothetical protein JHK87_019206 [Glycine soja]KAG5023428.1 hypothetical protein JHK85_019770 [Glycine max]KAH1087777.1 hypothetical protein GYH30_019044 [Glycine max]KHN31003.1 Phospholipase A1-IIgamma [Glycine soja]KRH50162.1 hypothetical protein GLYMA_07G204900v4 [Glycine max]|eukprot:XP_003528482.1 phospholipase A1-IIgamma [Glycine max]